ncbi:MAG: polysaccharide deacetylase family protein [Oscillospiraceae bacterium]|nr:polysaccharide deacetylase family protein [Oscillospiraceae bacterium]
MGSKHKLSSKGWLVLFVFSAALLAVGLGVFNVVTDPFGVFGDRVLEWWSYDETNNPRVAKFSYLEQHHDEYDSYIIGCSSTSSFPKEQLDQYFDANFYNLIMYGADMLDVEQYVHYLLEHYLVKNLVINVYIDNGVVYDNESDAFTGSMPWQVDGSSPVSFYSRYLFADPRYGWTKLNKLRTDSVIQDVHDVFEVESGAYDKSRRDVEPIGSLETYLTDYPAFVYYPMSEQKMTQTENCMKSVGAIRDMCREAGVNLMVVTAPVYYDYLLCFDRTEVESFYTALAEEIPYWDFSVSSVSREPRYFYDETHFRNCVGKMALARAFGDDTVYIPEDFGVYVTPENATEHVSRYWDVPEPDVSAYTVKIPILRYQNFEEKSLSVTQIEEQITTLDRAGYTAVSFEDLRAYVEQGRELPEKPVVITFDGGCLDSIAGCLPVLEKYGMKATVFVIGSLMGKDTYKDTGETISSHFSLEQAGEMLDTGLIMIGSCGWDIYKLDVTAPIRCGILRREDESEKGYTAFLREDIRLENELLSPALDGDVAIFAFPYGLHDTLSEILLREAGFYATVTVSSGENTIIKGLPQSLLCMNRYDITENVSPKKLLALIGET